MNKLLKGNTMKKGTILFILLIILSFNPKCSENQNLIKNKNQENKAIEIPKLAFKLLADSSVDPCSICAKKLIKQAFAILNRKFSANRKIIGNSSYYFVKTDECGPNEFILSSYKSREPYKPKEAESELLFPMLVFRFHTDKINLIGIQKENFTQSKYSMLMNKKSSSAEFQGEIKIIEYQYGDGPTYNYYKKKNQVQIHCKVLKLEKISTRI